MNRNNDNARHRITLRSGRLEMLYPPSLIQDVAHLATTIQGEGCFASVSAQLLIQRYEVALCIVDACVGSRGGDDDAGSIDLRSFRECALSCYPNGWLQMVDQSMMGESIAFRQYPK